MNKKRIEVEGWRYYNHAAIPTTAPHEKVNMKPLTNGDIWKIKDGTPLFARYCTDWNCNEETEWWYVIKDSPFDIMDLNSNRRHKINKALKNFKVKQINYIQYEEEICEIAFCAWKTYPKKYRPIMDKTKFIKEIENWKDAVVYGAFDNDNKLCGYTLLNIYPSYINFTSQKVLTYCEKKYINFSLIYAILMEYNDKLSSNFYICDGSRNIIHETQFQDFLEKYFGFRKCYCKLEIVYKFPVNVIIKILRPLYKYIGKFGNIGSKIKAVLFMDCVVRECKEKNK